MAPNPIQSMLRNAMQNIALDVQASLPEGLEIEHFRLQVSEPDAPDVALADRILTAYHKAIADGAITGGGLWTQMSDTFHGSVYEAVSDPQNLAPILARFFQHPISAGICRAPWNWQKAENDAAMQSLYFLDALYSVGSSAGLVPHYHGGLPKTQDGPVFSFEPQALFDRLQQACGFDIWPAQVGGVFGGPNAGKLVPVKFLYQVEMVRWMQSKLTTLGAPARVLEIGGGAGLLAELFCRSQDVAQYTIIDLPLVNMMQAYYLLKSDQASFVQLYGEADPGLGKTIQVFPTIQADMLEKNEFDVALNQDSFPEMDGDTVTGYLNTIKNSTRSWFFSINHESALTTGVGFTHAIVPELIAPFAEFSLVSREIFWPRKGYVSEVYAIE